MSTKTMTIETIERQKKYVKEQKEKGGGIGVVFAAAFLRGMRDLGYKNPAWAVAEMIENSFQAAATGVAVRFGFDKSNTSRAKPDQVAILDNGNGMIPEMIGFAVRWGGTDREGDRTGLGRYGYGLPSAAVSLAKRYTVYSKAANAGWNAVTVDIDELSKLANSPADTEKYLVARPATPPAWLDEEAHDDDQIKVSELKSGTIVVLEDLDRLRRLAGWITVKTLREKFLDHFGVIYRHWIPERRIVIDGVATIAADPLFQMPHGKAYDATPSRAEILETRTFEVDGPRKKPGTVKIRASVLPPDFQLTDPSKYTGDDARGGTRYKPRWDLMRDYNGILICRQGRQIDCIRPHWTKFVNYDANVKIEIDFDPELDEYFGITTAKQQIVIDDGFLETLMNPGPSCGNLRALVKDMRSRFDELAVEVAAKWKNAEAAGVPRASATAMDETEKFKGRTVAPTPAQSEEAETNLDVAAKERAAKTGETPSQAKAQVVAQTEARKWEIEFVSFPEGPFYRPQRLGLQKRVQINTDHPYYTRLYAAGSAEVRSALEVMLFVLAERELESQGDAETFYKAERQRWSERLRHALKALVPDDKMADKAASVRERLYDGDGSPAPDKGE